MQEIKFQIGNDYLDLLPGTVLELEEENPFLQLENEETGPYSLPFDVPHTPKNIRLLKLSSAIYSNKSDVSIDCILWENGIQHSVGTLKIEQVNASLNDLNTGTTSLYYLTGSSYFLQQISDKTLRQCDYGGTRNEFAGIPPNTITWEQVLAKAKTISLGNINTHDYTFFPIRNPGLVYSVLTGLTANIMNNVEIVGGNVQFAYWSNSAPVNGTNVGNGLFPMPYLMYVLQRVFISSGWTVESDFFTDPNYKKLVLVSLKAVGEELKFGYDLKDYMPSVTITEFLIALKKRFGWWYDFDNRAKVCRIRYVQDVFSSNKVDITPMVSPAYQNKVDDKGKIFRLVNNFDPQDAAPQKGTVKGKESLGASIGAPVAASITHSGKVYLELKENAWYICQLQENSTTIYEWVKYIDNVYDYEPENSTDEVTTNATTLLMERITTNGVVALMPYMDQNGVFYNGIEAEFGIRLLFYHGWHPDANGKKLSICFQPSIYHGWYQNWRLGT